MNIELTPEELNSDKMDQPITISGLVEQAHAYSGSYILTQKILDKLELIISTNPLNKEPSDELLVAWDEIAKIVQEAKETNLGPNLSVA